MAGGGAKGKIGEAYIDITADPTKAKQGLKEAEQATERMADKVEGSTKRGARSFGEFSTAISGAAGKFTALAGVATAAAGVLLLVVKSTQEVIKYFEAGTVAAEKFKASLTLGSDVAATELQTITQRLAELDAQLARNAEGGVMNAIFGRRTQQIKEERDALADTAAGLRDMLRAQQLRTREDEKAAELAKLRAKHAEDEEKALEHTAELLRKQDQQRINDAEERLAADKLFREKRERELALEEEKARRYAETMARELEDRLFGNSGILLNNNLVGPLQNIQTVVQRLESRMPRQTI